MRRDEHRPEVHGRQLLHPDLQRNLDLWPGQEPVKLVFGNAGFHVFKVGNADAPIAKTYVAGVDAKSPVVVLVMSYLPAGTPFVAYAVKYQDHMVDIYLGADFKTANINPKPTTEIALPDGKACVPNVKALTGS